MHLVSIPSNGSRHGQSASRFQRRASIVDTPQRSSGNALGTRSHRFQAEEHWFDNRYSTQIISKRNILRHVGKGWFSRAGCRVRDRLFWSYCIFMFRQEGSSTIRLLYLLPGVIPCRPDQVVHHSRCSM